MVQTGKSCKPQALVVTLWMLLRRSKKNIFWGKVDSDPQGSDDRLWSVTTLVTKLLKSKVMLSISITLPRSGSCNSWNQGYFPELIIQGHSRIGRIRVAPFPKGTHTARWILEGCLKSNNTLHFMFLLVIMISCHYTRLPSKWSYPGPCLLPCSLLILPPAWAMLVGSSKQSGALHTSSPGSQLGKNAGCCAGWKAWESAVLLFHVNIPPPLPFPRSPAENPFLFLSVQTRTMNSSSPQECDKVPTKPTRKVMYGL